MNWASLPASVHICPRGPRRIVLVAELGLTRNRHQYQHFGLEMFTGRRPAA